MLDLNKMVPDNMTGRVQEDIAWSPMQEDIFDAGINETVNLIIEAVAGSGKTTTILELMRRLNSTNVLFLAFNKSIQQELATRVPPGITAKTFNSLGHAMVKRKHPKSNLNMYRTSDIVRSVTSTPFAREYGYTISRIIGSAKHEGAGIRTPLDQEFWDSFVRGGTHFIEPKDLDKVAEICKAVFDLCLDDLDNQFDFDDQLWVPVYYDQTFPAYETVFVDEAQDLSPIQHMQLQKLADRGARIIAVGDSYQAIYAFRGADSKSMSRLRRTFDAKMLPLSVCYRCDRDIVQKASTIVPHIEFREGAPAGNITHHDEMPDFESFPEKSMVMCRTNAPLMTLAAQFLAAEVPCHVVMDFAKGLLKLIDKQKVTRADELEAKLRKWAEKEVQKLENAGRTHLIGFVEDQLGCILPFCEKNEFVAQIKSDIQRLTQSEFGPRLSSVHKAKGLEADHAYILRPDLMPHPKADPDDTQEDNLRYVAWTRAKHHLHFLPEEGE